MHFSAKTRYCSQNFIEIKLTQLQIQLLLCYCWNCHNLPLLQRYLDIKHASAGIVSTENQHPPASGRQEDYLSCGPMCRYAQDLKLMLKIMAGNNAPM